ncbi:MAG: phosphotransferase [bacterium]|nr:phosphotransferase [bacterium]
MKDRGRQHFDASELGIALSHYELGVIESITPFEGGSRKSPKVGIVCAQGKFVLKRRDTERGSLPRIRFAHAVQAHLSAAGFPLPALIQPVDSSDTMLMIRDQVYELFEFVAGHSYRGTEASTSDAGTVLGRFHRLVGDFTYDVKMPAGDFHDALAVRTGLNAIPSQLSGHKSVTGREGELLGVAQALFDAYDRAADEVDSIGLSGLGEGVVHSDWHPGNMMFRRERVVAVIDYDSVRHAKLALDVANGLLQFSMSLDPRPENWPDALDEQRLLWFLAGYESERPLTEAEKRCLLPLMIEALIAECVVPIAATGFFGRLQGFGFMKIVRRRVGWLEENAERMTEQILACTGSSGTNPG